MNNCGYYNDSSVLIRGKFQTRKIENPTIADTELVEQNLSQAVKLVFCKTGIFNMQLRVVG